MRPATRAAAGCANHKQHCYSNSVDSQSSSQQAKSVKSPLTTAIGAAIRGHREGLGMCQEAFAEIVGLHRTYIGSLERGERNPSIQTLARVLTALNLSLADFFGGLANG